MTKNKKTKNVPGSILDNRMRQQVELEVISQKARLRITRVLRQGMKSSDSENSHQIELIRCNKIVNLANTVLGRPIYTLELVGWDYEPAEYAWHNGELELVIRRPDTAQLVEIMADLAEAGCIRTYDVNAILESDDTGIRLFDADGRVAVELTDVSDLPDTELTVGEHKNIRQLVERMDAALQDRDWSLVLHSGASIFETLAKQIVPNPNVQSQSLGSWFSLYRNHSKLSTPLLDTIEDIFKRRNIEPLAGHGSASDPLITEKEANQVRELTIALVRLERILATISINHPLVVKKKGKS